MNINLSGENIISNLGGDLEIQDYISNLLESHLNDFLRSSLRYIVNTEFNLDNDNGIKLGLCLSVNEFNLNGNLIILIREGNCKVESNYSKKLNKPGFIEVSYITSLNQLIDYSDVICEDLCSLFIAALKS